MFAVANAILFRTDSSPDQQPNSKRPASDPLPVSVEKQKGGASTALDFHGHFVVPGFRVLEELSQGHWREEILVFSLRPSVSVCNWHGEISRGRGSGADCLTSFFHMPPSTQDPSGDTSSPSWVPLRVT